MRLTVLVIVVCVSVPAWAVEYEMFIATVSEDDLYDLLDGQEISADTFNAIIELYQRGVDLNRASREELYSLPNLSYREVDAILAYRTQLGHIADPAVLVAAAVLSARKLRALAPFLKVRDPDKPPLAPDVWVRARGVWVAGTENSPPAAWQMRVGAGDYIFGLASVLMHNRLGKISYDPREEMLVAEAPEARWYLPKLYLQYETDDMSAIAGTYRIGFGQRLTFDNTRRYTPSGFYLDDVITSARELVRSCKESAVGGMLSPCSDDARYQYTTPDYRWSDGLRGVALGGKNIKAGAGWIQAYGFFSRTARSIYQYEVYDRGKCADSRYDQYRDCSPWVLRQRDDMDEPGTRFIFHTLPGMYRETLIGGNVTYFLSQRAHIGLTGYRAGIEWLVQGIDLDFQEWSRYPFGGGFGAAGLDGAWGRGRTDVYFELARSFDSMADDGGGGFGAVIRTISDFSQSEIEGSLRYYQRKFANPYARPISAPDEYEGLRARDELGVRMRYTGAIGRHIQVRTNADLWSSPSDAAVVTAKFDWRGDYTVSKQWRPGLRMSYKDGVVCDEVLDPLEQTTCNGGAFMAAGSLRWQLHRWFSVVSQLQWTKVPADNRHDIRAWVKVNAWPTSRLRIRTQLKYLYEGICRSGGAGNRSARDCQAGLFTGLEGDKRSLRTYIDLLYRYRQHHRLHLRYDLVLWLDHRDSTMMREPSPEHWFSLQLETRF